MGLILRRQESERGPEGSYTDGKARDLIHSFNISEDSKPCDQGVCMGFFKFAHLWASLRFRRVNEHLTQVL